MEKSRYNLHSSRATVRIQETISLIQATEDAASGSLPNVSAKQEQVGERKRRKEKNKSVCMIRRENAYVRDESLLMHCS